MSLHEYCKPILDDAETKLEELATFEDKDWLLELIEGIVSELEEMWGSIGFWCHKRQRYSITLQQVGLFVSSVNLFALKGFGIPASPRASYS